jgi:hypothetical protein
MYKVFISSTSKDFEEYRAAVVELIHGFGDDYRCIVMNYFGAHTLKPADLCVTKVRECDLFIGILGHYYGSCPEHSDLSYTELEYDTAGKAGISRLMFLATDDFLIPVNLREPDEKWERQQKFRRRVEKRETRGTFNTLDELKVAVQKALRNWEPERKKARAAKTRRHRQVGPGTHKMCDRTEQEADFIKFFSAQVTQRPGWPQIFLLPAPENERPVSLVERFKFDKLDKYAEDKWGKQRGVVLLKPPIECPSLGTPEERIERFQVMLFKQFAPLHRLSGDFSAAVFKQILTVEPETKLVPVVMVQHKFYVATWSKAEKKLLEQYLRFWDEVGAHSPPQQFLVFMLIIHQVEKKNGFWQKLFRSAADKKTVASDLRELNAARQQSLNQALQQPCPTLLLEELSCIRPSHVMDWFSQYGSYDDEEICSQKCEEIFQGSNCQPMRVVEGKLRAIVENRG